jgi:hypothetical protein
MAEPAVSSMTPATHISMDFVILLSPVALNKPSNPASRSKNPEFYY